MNRIRYTIPLLGLFAVVILLASLNRKLGLELLDVKVMDVLCVRDLLTLFVFAPVMMVLGWLLFRVICVKSYMSLECAVILGVFLLGMGFGMHESANALSVSDIQSPEYLRRSINFFDNSLGHWIFFAGFMVVTLLLSATEVSNPLKYPVPKRILSLAIVIGLSVATCIYFNMSSENATLDIAVLAACALVPGLLRNFCGRSSFARTPITLALHVAFYGGVIATLVKWIF